MSRYVYVVGWPQPATKCHTTACSLLPIGVIRTRLGTKKVKLIGWDKSSLTGQQRKNIQSKVDPNPCVAELHLLQLGHRKDEFNLLHSFFQVKYFTQNFKMQFLSLSLPEGLSLRLMQVNLVLPYTL